MIQEERYTGTANRQEDTNIDIDAGLPSVDSRGNGADQPDLDVEEQLDSGHATEPKLPLDVTFEILKNRRRRIVLDYIRDTEEAVTIGELAEHIAAIENDIPVTQLNAQQRKRVYIGLYQCHLPKMDDAGVVEFNQGRGTVDVTPTAEQLYDYLDTESVQQSSTTSTRFIAITAFTSVGFLLAQFSGAYAVATFVVLAYLGTVIWHAIRPLASRELATT